MESVDLICCPKCKWEPLPKSCWHCSCGHKWNTFDTGGECPSCKKQWKETQCHDCSIFSPHLDWYTKLADNLEEELSTLESITL